MGSKIAITFALLIAVIAIVLLMRVPGGERVGDSPIVLFCGASMRPPLDEIIGAFQRRTGHRVQTHYGASSLLLSQLKLAPEVPDVFLPGDTYYIEQARREGLIRDSKKVALFVPTIMVQANNPHGIETLADLASPRLRLGLGDERATAIGRIIPELLDLHGLSADALAANVVFTAATGPELANAVVLGHVDAAILWREVALQHEHAQIVAIPPEKNVTASLVAGLVDHHGIKPAAREFVEFLASPVAAGIFEVHHYEIPLDQPEK